MSMESFDWDSEKDRRNRAKHGVSFEAAQYAFFDSGLVFGDGANKFMSRKTKYTDEPLGRVRVVPDFLPSPEALVPRDDTVKITIALSKSSVAFSNVRRRSTIPNIRR